VPQWIVHCVQQVCETAAHVLSHRYKQLLAYASGYQHQPSRAAMIGTNTSRAVYAINLMACCVQVANLARYMGCCNGFDAVHDCKSSEMSQMSKKAGIVTATVPKYALIYSSV